MQEDVTVTMDDIAREAGVTKATVSMVLRNRGSISEETRKRVLDLARQFQYTPSTRHQRRGRVHHGQLGLLYIAGRPLRVGPEPGGGYLLGIVQGVQEQAENAGYSVVFSIATRQDLQEGKVPAALWRQPLDGLLIRGLLDERLASWLNEKQIRYALIDCDADTQNHDVQVNIDNIAAMEYLVEHLVQLGCRQFATLTGSLDHINGRERLAGLQAALLKRGLELPPSHVVVARTYDEEAGRAGVEQLSHRSARYDALICQNDLMAAEAIQTLIERGRKVPQDVKVTGFDNMSFASMLPVPLTTINSRPVHLGQLGVQLFLSRLDSARTSDTLCVRVPGELVVRASTSGCLTTA